MQRGRILALGLGLLATLAARATAQSVAGIVMESRTGRPIEGARVVVQGTPTEMRTDGRGRFAFTGQSGSQVTLAVSFVGFRPLTQVVRVGDTDVRLQMTELAVNLGELVVTGTPQAVEKRTLGNSTATVHAADQQQFAPSPDVSGLINSRAPGVVVIPGTGQVGSGPRIRIRGANSFSLTDQPL
ncbi:MAG: carboxypeptidase-like regulatory domain-containing protein, partial [Gemmatimonadota bacterium]